MRVVEKHFSVKLRYRKIRFKVKDKKGCVDSENAIYEGSATFATVRAYPKRQCRIEFWFNPGRSLFADIRLPGDEPKKATQLLEILDNPLSHTIVPVDIKTPRLSLLAIAVAGPLRGALAAMLVTEDRTIGLGRLSPDVERYLAKARPDYDWSVKPKSCRNSMRFIIELEVRKWRLLFSALSKVELKRPVYCIKKKEEK